MARLRSQIRSSCIFTKVVAMEKENPYIKIKSNASELIIALLAWYIAHQLYTYFEMITFGIISLTAAVLVHRLYFMSIKHEDWVKHSNWFKNRKPFPKNFQYVVSYFVIYVVLILGIRQLTLSAIWLVNSLINTISSVR